MKRTIKLFVGGLLAFVLISMTIAIATPDKHVVHAGTPSGVTSDTGTQSQEQSISENNQATLDKNQPVPQVTNSLERANLIKKLNFTNNSNQLGYVYLLSLDGKVIAEYTVKGKISSLNSLLTTTEQVRCPGSEGRGCVALTSPDLDGSYGTNPDGIFFFTTEGAYVEWSGTYIYSSQSMNIQTPLSLTRNVQ